MIKKVLANASVMKDMEASFAMIAGMDVLKPSEMTHTYCVHVSHHFNDTSKPNYLHINYHFPQCVTIPVNHAKETNRMNV